MSHTCHADNCTKEVPPKMFMCFRHWSMVPKPMQKDIWDNYRLRQEVDKNPSQGYLKAAQRARFVVAMKEKGYSRSEIRLKIALLGKTNE